MGKQTIINVSYFILNIAVLHFGQKTKFYKCIKCVATEDGIEKNKWVILTRFFCGTKILPQFYKRIIFDSYL